MTKKQLSSRQHCALRLIVAWLVCASLCMAMATSSNSTTSNSSSTTSNYHHSKATQARQSPMSAASAIVGALGSIVPGLISQVAPIVLLVGLSALVMPQLGLSAMGLLRESRRSAQDPHQQIPFGSAAQFPGSAPFALPRPLQTTPQDIYYYSKRSLGSSWVPNSEQVLHGIQEVLERVSRALENAEKRYNN